VFHIPLPFIQKNEFPDIDLFTVISKHADTIRQVIAGHWHLWFDLGDTSGAPHMVVASTRYDEDSFAIVELTTDTHEFHWVGQELWKMQDHYTDPWKF
jgi:hypothetical protein